MIYIDVQGKQIPALGFGTWKLRGAECRDAVEAALKIGYRHFDTARMYGNEADVGAALAASGIKRSEVFVTTKVWFTDVRLPNMQKAIDDSLKSLKMDHVDLLLIHWPTEEVPFPEQVKALKHIQKEDKARLIGVSNFTVVQLMEVVQTLHSGIVCNQVEYHPYLSQKRVLNFLRMTGLFLTAYTPLAQGQIYKDPVILKVAAKHGKTPAQVTLRWLLQQDSVSAIPKAASEAHMRENFDIFTFTLDATDMQDISSLARRNGRLSNPDFAPEWDK